MSKQFPCRHFSYFNKDGYTGRKCSTKKTENCSQDAERTKPTALVAIKPVMSPAEQKDDKETSYLSNFVYLLLHSAAAAITSSRKRHKISGTTAYMTYGGRLLNIFEDGAPFGVEMDNSKTVTLHGFEAILPNFRVSDNTFKCLLKRVIYVAELRYHLILVSTIKQDNGMLKFHQSRCIVFRGLRVVPHGARTNSLSCLDKYIRSVPNNVATALIAADLCPRH